jgi:hypothetical protein
VASSRQASPSPEYGAKPFVESLLPLLETARTAHLQLSLENTPETFPDYVNAVFNPTSRIRTAIGPLTRYK